MNKKRWLIYQLKSPSGKIYIGITCMKLKRRIQKHNQVAKKGMKIPLSYAIRKYGIDNFKKKILKKVYTREDAIKWEIFYIEKYQSNAKGVGYNATYGGDYPSEKYSGNYWKVGKTKEEIELINKKKSLPGELNPFYGKKHSKESMLKMVTTRIARGSYPAIKRGKIKNSTAMGRNNFGRQKLIYKNKKYNSKYHFMSATGVKRYTMERMIKDGEIKVYGEYFAESKNRKRVKYKGNIYDSKSELAHELGVSYKILARMERNGEIHVL